MAKNLIRKGNALYCRVTIPRPLRQYFLNEAGKPSDAIWETLGPDYTVAKPKCAARVAYWEGVFARMRAGESLDDIKAADERERQRARVVAYMAHEQAKLMEDLSHEQVMEILEGERESLRALEERLGMAPAPV